MRQNLLFAPIFAQEEIDIAPIYGLMDILIMNLRTCSNLDVEAPLFLNAFAVDDSPQIMTFPYELPYEPILQTIAQFESNIKYIFLPTIKKIKYNVFSFELKCYDISDTSEIYQQSWQGKLHEISNLIIKDLKEFVRKCGFEYDQKEEKWPKTENPEALELFFKTLYDICCFRINISINNTKKNIDSVTKVLDNLKTVFKLDTNLDIAIYRLLGFIEEVLRNPLLPGNIYSFASETLQNIEKNRDLPGEVFIAIASVFNSIGDEKGVLRNFTRAKKKNPSNPEIIVSIGNFYENKKQLLKARNLYQKFLKEYSDDSCIIAHNLGTILAEMGYLEKALPYWLKSLQQNKKNSGTYINLMNAYFERKEYPKMWIAFEESLKHSPILWTSYEYVIRNLSKAGDYTSAIYSLQEYITKYPQDSGSYFYLGILYHLQKRNRKALFIWKQGLQTEDKTFHDDICQEILAIKMPSFRKKFLEASTKIMEGKPKEGIAFFQHCTLELPEFWQGWFFLGRCYTRLNQTKEAFECFERASKISPDNTLILTELGITAMLTDKKDIALACFRYAATLAPQIPDHLSNLAIALIEAKDYEQAEWAVQRALNLRPGDTVLKKIQNLITSFKNNEIQNIPSEFFPKPLKNRKKIDTQSKPAQE